MAVVRLNPRAVRELLLSLHQPVHEAAEAVAAKLRADPAVARARAEQGREIVNVRQYATDRAGAVVNLDHWAGLLMQHRDGSITRAVTACGLELVPAEGQEPES